MEEVVSEVWGDQFLETLSTDIFDDIIQSSNKDENANTKQPARFTNSFDCKLRDGGSVSFQITSNQKSTIDLVGLQIWRGAFLLSDFILTHPEIFQRKVVLELAAGTGFTSVVAGTLAKKVICTDVDRSDILDLVRENIEQNERILKEAHCSVKEIDFFKTDWQQSLAEDIKEIDVILVADVVYSKEVTVAFFKTLIYLLDNSTSCLEVYIAIERRLHAGDQGKLISPNFDLFLNQLQNLQKVCPNVLVSKISINLDQPFRDYYNRVEELCLWKLSKVSK